MITTTDVHRHRNLPVVFAYDYENISSQTRDTLHVSRHKPKKPWSHFLTIWSRRMSSCHAQASLEMIDQDLFSLCLLAKIVFSSVIDHLVCPAFNTLDSTPGINGDERFCRPSCFSATRHPPVNDRCLIIPRADTFSLLSAESSQLKSGDRCH